MNLTNDQKLKIIQSLIDKVEISEFNIDKLLDYQIPHVKNLIFSLNRFGIALDLSDTGTGKTHTSIAICKQLNLKPFIICPLSIIDNWYKVCEISKVEPLGIINYEKIKNNKYYENFDAFQEEKDSLCPYIKIIKKEKKDVITGELILKKNGNPSLEIETIIWELPRDTLIIFDEAHKAKNGLLSNSQSVNSLLTVSVKPYLNIVNKIYLLCLSATITDKPECFDVILYLFGFYKPYLKKNYQTFLNDLSKTDNNLIIKKIRQLLIPLRGSRMCITNINTFKKNDIQAKTYLVSKEIAERIEQEHQNIQEHMAMLNKKEGTKGLGFIIKCWCQIECLKSNIIANEAINYHQNMLITNNRT